jgi:hypothetical protein
MKTGLWPKLFPCGLGDDGARASGNDGLPLPGELIASMLQGPGLTRHCWTTRRAVPSQWWHPIRALGPGEFRPLIVIPLFRFASS